MMMSSGIPTPNMLAPSKCGNRLNSITLRQVSLFAVIAIAALGPSTLRSRLTAAGPESAGAERQFTSSVNLVEVYASVVDASGQPIRGLSQEDFEVTEDGERQAVSAFTAGDFPLTVAIALDHSFSMAGSPLAGVKRGTRSFLTALRPTDEAIVLGISSQVEVVAPARQPRAEQIAAVQALTAWGTTTLHDAILAAIDSVDGSRGRRALVILSDGDDRYSETSAAEATARARRSNVIVYPVALGSVRPPLFAELATLTGGRSYHARELQGLEQTMTSIAEQLREQYLIGYSPARPPVSGSNEWRSIQVRVKKPGASVRARDGYYVR
jgi:Ca-activated chloride channel family protein